jgi:protein-S-isoprenylcysteine O-methyltransferase Ste14
MRIIRVLVVNLIFSGLVIAVIGFIIYLDRRWLCPLPEDLEIFAWPLLILGSFLVIPAALTLWKHGGSTGAPTDPTRKLVTIGIYRWLRNPIYLGDVLLLFGLSFSTRSIAVLILAILFVPSVDLFVRLYEEPRAERRFGEDYRQYKHSVPRWIPRFPRK